MRSAANVSQQLRRLDRGKTLSKLPPEMRSFLEGIRKSGVFQFCQKLHPDSIFASIGNFFFPRLRSGHRLFQRPSPIKQNT